MVPPFAFQGSMTAHAEERQCQSSRMHTTSSGSCGLATLRASMPVHGCVSAKACWDQRASGTDWIEASTRRPHRFCRLCLAHSSADACADSISHPPESLDSRCVHSLVGPDITDSFFPRRSGSCFALRDLPDFKQELAP